MGRVARRTASWVAVLLVLAVVVPGCNEEKETDRQLLSQVQGTWTAQQGRWQGRSFEIRGDSILFDQGEGRTRAYGIRDVEVASVEEGVRYTLRYRDMGEESEFSFVYRPPRGGEVFLERAEGIPWRPTDAGAGSDTLPATRGGSDTLSSSDDPS